MAVTEYDSMYDAGGAKMGETVSVDGKQFVKTAGAEGSGIVSYLKPVDTGPESFEIRTLPPEAGGRSYYVSKDESGLDKFEGLVPLETESTVKEETVVDAEPAVAADTGVTETVSRQTEADTGVTKTVSDQTAQAFQGTAESSSSADTVVSDDTEIVNPNINVGEISNLTNVNVPQEALDAGATHYNSATGQYGVIPASTTKTVGTGTYIDQVVKDADGNTVFEDKEVTKTVPGEDKEVIKEGAEPKPELFTFDVNDIVAKGGARFGGDARSYIDVPDGQGGTKRIKTNREVAITQDLLDAGLGDHEYYKGNLEVRGKKRGTGGEVARVFSLALDHINKLNIEQQKKIDAWEKENITYESTTKTITEVEKVPKVEQVEKTKQITTIGKFEPVDYEIKKEEQVGPTGPIDTSGLTDINVLANQSPDVLPGNVTGVTQADIDRSNRAVLDQMSRGSPVTSVSVPQPTYAAYQPVTQTFQPQAVNQTGAATNTYGMANVPGTQQTALQTAGLSAVPQTIQVKPQYTGTTLQNVSSISQQGFGGQVVYVNQFGQQVTVSVDATGKPLTYVPPGFLRGIPDGQGGFRYPGSTTQGQYQGGMTSYALGGDVQGQLRLASKFLGYKGEATKDSLDAFLNSNPGAAAKMGQYEKAMMNMAQPVQQMYQGGIIQGYQEGNFVTQQQYDNAANYLTNTFKLGQKNYGQMFLDNPTGYTGFKQATPGKISIGGIASENFTPEVQNTINALRSGATVKTTDTGKNTGGNTGGVNQSGVGQPQPDFYYESARPMAEAAIKQTLQPIQAPVNYITPQPADFIGSTAGQTAPVAPMAEAATVGSVTQSQMPQVSTAGQMTDISKAQTGVATEVAKLQPQTSTVTRGDLPAQQQTTSAVTDLTAAAGQMQQFDPVTGMPLTPDPSKELFEQPKNEFTRELKRDPVTGEFTELISGSANAAKAAEFTKAVQLDTALPSVKATVAGQLNMLMRDFEGGDTPAWAAGSMRAANAAMLERGLGASSMAGQAIIQATMEAALPIAMADAQTQASFEAQNLSNRQARSMLAAQQRASFIGQEFDQAFQSRVQNAAKISDIANQNFSADQTIQLENSRAAQTLSLTNLSNNQALVMAEAAALAGLDTQNLNNRQQAAVQNAQNFLQMDMANLTNKQQTGIFKTQQNVQALFTDQAAENASKQFNATSTNQTNQFFANLATQTAQFNAAQTNAMDQFNINAVNGLREFNSNIQQQRDLFNAQNGLLIAQANAKWRQDLTTLNNATQNESNMDFAKTINGLTSKNLDAIWQRERDIMSNVNQTDESAKDRALRLIIADKELASAKEALDYAEDVADTQLLTRFLFPNLGSLFGTSE